MQLETLWMFACLLEPILFGATIVLCIVTAGDDRPPVSRAYQLQCEQAWCSAAAACSKAPWLTSLPVKGLLGIAPF